MMPIMRAITATAAGAVFILLLYGNSWAVIGTGSEHNFTNIQGYVNGFGPDVCAACHTSHVDSGKRLWQSGKEAENDNLRDLSPAMAQSRDQLAGGEYPGIYLCLDCHSPSSAAPSWSKTPARTAENVVTHSTREMRFAGYSTKYTTFVTQCTTCHVTHSSWNGSFQPGGNGYAIRSSIQTPNSGVKQVIFRAMSGANSMGNEYPSHTSICEVCHTQTLYHKNTASTSHYPGSNCIICHTHTSGFAGHSCSGCHGDPPTSQQTLVGRSLKNGYAATGETSPGMHAYHNFSVSGISSYGCTTCHNGGMSTGGPIGKTIIVKFNAFNTYTSGSFDAFAPISGYTFSAGNTEGGTQSCANTYCHGNFNGGNRSNKPVWTQPSTGACGTCHATAPPALKNHSVHLTAPWGPMAVCSDCHPVASANGSPSHVDGVVRFKDGQNFANTTVCNGCHGSGAAAAKAYWGHTTIRSYRFSDSWCEGCHNGTSTINTSAGTGGTNEVAQNVVGDGMTYGYDVTGHGKITISATCVNCHNVNSLHIGVAPYKASSGNYQSAFRMGALSNTVPLLANYSSGKFRLCYYCHSETSIMGMPPMGRPSAKHVHSPISAAQWGTDFRNTSTVAGLYAGNWDTTTQTGYTYDIPTNIHWNHVDAYGSSGFWKSRLGWVYDSDGDGMGDSYITCKTCHDPHGTRQRGMVYDAFAIGSFSVLANQSANPNYSWVGGNNQYVTNRCTSTCHSSGDLPGTAGMRWYRVPIYNYGSGMPLGLTAEPLP